MPSDSVGEIEAERASSRLNRRSVAMLVYLTAAAVLCLDQATKAAAAQWLRPLSSVPLAGDWVSLTWATNTGGAFGLFSSATGFLVGLTAVVTAALIVVAPHLGRSRLLAVSVASLLGGALGNLVDRVRLGYVIDFIDLHFWPIFNIADIAITVGAALLVIAMLLGHPESCADPKESN